MFLSIARKNKSDNKLLKKDKINKQKYYYFVKTISYVKTVLLFIFVFNLLFKELGAQDAVFSQFYANPLYLNPALSGSKMHPSISLNYRNQWAGLPSAYINYSASFDSYIKAIHGGLGVQFNSDNQGEGLLKNSNVSIAYAHFFNVTHNLTLSMGFQTAFVQQKFDWNNLIFRSMIDESTGTILPSNETPIEPDRKGIDFSTGIVGYTKQAYFGVAVHHLAKLGSINRHKDLKYLPPKYTAHFGITIALNNKGLKEKKAYISPNIIFQQQQEFQQLNYGIYFMRKIIVSGVWFRQNFTPYFGNDAVVLLLGFRYANFKLGYSYDITVSELIDTSGGSHEVSFSMQIGGKNSLKNLRSKAIRCPSF